MIKGFYINDFIIIISFCKENNKKLKEYCLLQYLKLCDKLSLSDKFSLIRSVIIKI